MDSNGERQGHPEGRASQAEPSLRAKGLRPCRAARHYQAPAAGSGGGSGHSPGGVARVPAAALTSRWCWHRALKIRGNLTKCSPGEAQGAGGGLLLRPPAWVPMPGPGQGLEGLAEAGGAGGPWGAVLCEVSSCCRRRAGLGTAGRLWEVGRWF